MTTPSDEITIPGVFSETHRIIKANRNHFSILTLLFLLPNYLSVFIYTTIFPIGPELNSTIAFSQIVYFIVSTFVSISATGTITYSAFHGYYNRPLELIPTLKSLSSSFIPLCSTFIVLQLIYYSIGIITGILAAAMYMWLGLEYFHYIIIAVVLVLCVCLIHLQMNWFISNVIVVVESKWGYEPLRRSSYLMKGMKKTALKMTVLCFVPGSLFMYSMTMKASSYGCWLWIFKMAVSCGMSVVAEYTSVAVVVLYVYCKKKHGESAMEIQPEEYVSLLIDEDGNKSVAAVVHA